MEETIKEIVQPVYKYICMYIWKDNHLSYKYRMGNINKEKQWMNNIWLSCWSTFIEGGYTKLFHHASYIEQQFDIHGK